MTTKLREKLKPYLAKLSTIQLVKMIVTLVAFAALIYFFREMGVDIKKPDDQLKVVTYFTLLATFVVNSTEFFQSGSKGVRADQDRQRIKKLEEDYADLRKAHEELHADFQNVSDKVESQHGQIDNLNAQIEQLTTRVKAMEKNVPA